VVPVVVPVVVGGSWCCGGGRDINTLRKTAGETMSIEERFETSIAKQLRLNKKRNLSQSLRIPTLLVRRVEGLLFS
jgi:hypothetical protein